MVDISVRAARASDSETIKRIEMDCDLSAWKESDYQLAADSDDWIILVAEVRRETAGFILMRLITITKQFLPRSRVPGTIPQPSIEPPFPLLTGEKPDPEVNGEGEICNIGVMQKFRKLGAGRKLIKQCIAVFEKMKAFSVFLEVRSSNATAIGFYENNGFLTRSRRPGYYTNPREDALTMEFSAKKAR